MRGHRRVDGRHDLRVGVVAGVAERIDLKPGGPRRWSGSAASAARAAGARPGCGRRRCCPPPRRRCEPDRRGISQAARPGCGDSVVTRSRTMPSLSSSGTGGTGGTGGVGLGGAPPISGTAGAGASATAAASSTGGSATKKSYETTPATIASATTPTNGPVCRPLGRTAIHETPIQEGPPLPRSLRLLAGGDAVSTAQISWTIIGQTRPYDQPSPRSRVDRSLRCRRQGRIAGARTVLVEDIGDDGGEGGVVGLAAEGWHRRP